MKNFPLAGQTRWAITVLTTNEFAQCLALNKTLDYRDNDELTS